MSRTLFWVALAASMFCFSASQAEEPAAALVDGYFDAVNAEQATYDAMRKTLQTPVSCAFNEAPLIEVTKYLSEKTGVEIRIDKRSLEYAGISPTELVTLSADNIRLQTALQLICQLTGDGKCVTYAIDGDRIILATPTRTETRLRVVYYPCADLIYDKHGEGPDYDALIAPITMCIDLESWEELGGNGVIYPGRNGLVVSQTDLRHEKIADLLAALRKAKGLSLENFDPTPIGVGLDVAEQRKTREALQKSLEHVDFDETPLLDVVRYLSNECDVQIVIDAPALKEIGLTPDMPITNRWRKATAETILHDIGDEWDLTFAYHDALIEITIAARLEENLEVKVYPLRDWLAAEPEDDWPSEMSCRLETSPYENISRQLRKYDSLIHVITANVDPTSWEELGGNGNVRPVWGADAIVVSQTPQVHAKLESLLAAIRRDQPSPPVESEATVPTSPIVIGYDFSREFGDEVRDQGDAHALDVFAQTIREEIEPQSWDGEKSFVRVAGSRLLIKQTPEVHRRIRRWIVTALTGLLPPKPPAKRESPKGTFSGPAQDGGVF